MNSDVRVADCDSDSLQWVIGQLCGDSSETKRDSSSCRVLRGADAEDVLVARNNDSLVGAIVARHAPGRVGWLWPPIVSGSFPPDADCVQVDHQLISAALSKLTRSRVRIVQALIPTHDPGGHELIASGFIRLTEMIRMERPSDLPSINATHSPSLEFAHFSKETRAEFLRVIERTYDGSQDCPELDAYRSVPEVVEGYQTSDSFRPDLWNLARENARSVGCVLLMHFPEENNCELQYMGVIPEARHRQIGRRLCSRAILDSVRIGARKLCLAVDARNRSALRLYESLGFVETERRTAYILKLSDR